MLNSLKISTRLGAYITLLLSTAVILAFFHRQVFEANQVSFASGGDGVKSTFGSLYHIEHDSSYWVFEGMNYPYGESVFYTGNQTFLTNLIKLCKDAGLDISAYTLGMFNLWMLFSFVICALLIYLILVDLGLPGWYAAAGSILIAFLSPQWDRMSGHYNLAYAWVIPLALYLMIRFYRKPRYWLSVVFGLFILAIGGKHVYFIALVGVPLGVFWLFLLIRSRSLYGKTAFLIPHFLIQFIVPVILFNLFVASHDAIVDRTAYPWGFFSNTTRLVSVFLPLMKSYGLWINVGPVKTLGYVGIVSTIVFIASMVLCVLRWTREGFKTAFIASDKFILNIFMLAGLICLIIALGYPFSWAHVLLNYTGPFRQFRAIGRFVIPFFYIMNIFTITILWQWYTSMGKQWFRDFIVIALVIMGFEAYSTIKDCPSRYHNKFETLNDRENSTADNHWVNNHDWTAYQAIMPMPYYHIGSENYWIGDGSPVTEESYIASLKTGLPLNSVMLSRTSISQTLANLDMYWEPGSNYPGLLNYKSGSPLLIVRHRNGRLNENEERILRNSKLIDSNSHIFFYRFYPGSLERILEEHASRIAEKAEFIEGDTTVRWNYFETYDSNERGLFSAGAKYYTEFAACSFPDSGKYMISFWYEGAGRDLWPRTILYISLFDTLMNSYHYRRTDFFRETVQREKDWALISVPVEVRNPGDYLKLHYINNILTGGEMVIDRVLVHAVADTILIRDEEDLLLNNRIVHAEK